MRQGAELPGRLRAGFAWAKRAVGHAKYVINIRDRLKAAGFCFDADSKVWYKALPLA